MKAFLLFAMMIPASGSAQEARVRTYSNVETVDVGAIVKTCGQKLEEARQAKRPRVDSCLSGAVKFRVSCEEVAIHSDQIIEKTDQICQMTGYDSIWEDITPESHRRSCQRIQAQFNSLRERTQAACEQETTPECVLQLAEIRKIGLGLRQTCPGSATSPVSD